MNVNLLGPSILGLLLLAVGGWMIWRKRSLKWVTWLWLVAGFCLSGLVVVLLAKIFGKTGELSGALFGVSATVVIGVAVVIGVLEIWHGARPRKGTAKIHTAILALLVPVALGTIAGGVLGGIYDSVNSLLGGLSGPVAAFFGG